MKHLSIIFALLLALLSSNLKAQDTTYLGGYRHISKDSIKYHVDTCYCCIKISEPDPVIVRLTEKLNAAYNILRLINVNGYIRKKDMPEFIKARDVYMKLNSKQ